MHPTRLLLARTPLIHFLGKRIPPSKSPQTPHTLPPLPYLTLPYLTYYN